MAYTPEALAQILDDMERYGGSFVHQLALLYRHADHVNQAKILSTWSNYFEDYSKRFNSTKP